MALIENKKTSLNEIFTSNTLKIPRYQRGYSWTKNEVEDFWSDLQQLTKENDLENHFLGLIVAHSDEINRKHKNIIDGQQRLSTSVILLDSLRKRFNKLHTQHSLEDANHYANLITNIIGPISSSVKIHNPKLIMGEKDKAFFTEYIQSTSKSEPIKSKLSKSNKLIYETSQYFDQQLEKLLSDLESQEQLNLLVNYFEKLSEDFTMMYIEADEVNEAFVIFETLNARGKALDTSDLLKNHIFRHADHKIDEIQVKWSAMIDNLDKLDATTYIRHYWNSQHEFTRTQSLYKTIRRKIIDQKSAEDLVNNLERYSGIYHSLGEPEIKSEFESVHINLKLMNLKSLRVKTFYPVILAMFAKGYKENDILNVLIAIETCIVRNIITAGQNPNSFEALFASIAFDITSGKLKNIDDIITLIKSNTLDDEQFKELFSNLTVKQDTEKRYLLRSIFSEGNDETMIINDNKLIHIEHIMPQKPDKWDVILEEAEEYKNKLGNLTLLGEEYNRNASNLPFEKKKEVYKKSKISLNKDISELNAWTYQDIKDRQNKLAEIALKVWPK